MKTTFQQMGGILTGIGLIGFATVWIAIWSICTLTADVVLAASLYYQVRALGFPHDRRRRRHHQIGGKLRRRRHVVHAGRRISLFRRPPGA